MGMPSTTLPTITEPQILTSYLLPPSPLPTILPYSSFLGLVPPTYRNDPAYAPALKRLYRDLQFQRSITVDQVRENIERECGDRAATLRARLTQQIAIEEGDKEIEREELRLERKRKRETARLNRMEETDSYKEIQIKDEDLSSEVDEFTDPRYLAAQQAMYDHPDSLHPAARVLPFPEELSENGVLLQDRSAFHSRASLLSSMQGASDSLQSEIGELEAECVRLKEGIVATVSALSDLRYGKRQNETDGSNEYRNVAEAIEDFRGVLTARIAS